MRTCVILLAGAGAAMTMGCERGVAPTVTTGTTDAAAAADDDAGPATIEAQDSSVPRCASPYGISFHGAPFEYARDTALALGVRFLRDTVFLEDETFRYDPDAVHDAGFAIALNVTNTVHRDPTDDAVASTVPEDFEDYKARIARAIDRARPEMIVVENEADVPAHFAGTPDQYRQMLEAACAVAHEQGITCTNDGPVSSIALRLTYQHYLDIGEPDLAQSFADRTGVDVSDIPTPGAIERAMAWVIAYRDAHPDYVNFHFYGDDGPALVEVAAFYSGATGVPAVTNEMGLDTQDAAVVESLMQAALDARMPLAQWWSSGARNIANTDGSLRPSGEAFRDFIGARFGCR